MSRGWKEDVGLGASAGSEAVSTPAPAGFWAGPQRQGPALEWDRVLRPSVSHLFLEERWT